MYREGQHHKGGQGNGQLSWTGPASQRILFFSFSWSTQSHRRVPDSAHSSDTCINGILAWNCRCWKVIVQKQLCLSYSLFLSLPFSYFTIVSFTDSSVLSEPLSVHPTALFHVYTHTCRHTPPPFSIHSFGHYWSVSALENCCACRACVITNGINHFPWAWLQDAPLISALQFALSTPADRRKALRLLSKA